MPDLWLPGAQRIDVGDHAPTDSSYPAKAIAHITWDKNATAAHPQDQVPYGNLQDWFGRNPDGKPSAPHLLWSPFTGAFTQFFPANSRSKSLVDLSGGTRTNRAGSVVIQIESHFFPYCRVGGKVYARLVDTPCTGWATLNAWVRSWGVPDTWPMGRPVDFTSHRDEHVWETQGGWYGHQQVPENTHQDPGSWPQFTGVPPQPKVSLAHVVAAARRDPGLPQGGTTYKAEVLVVERALQAEGLLSAAWVDGSFGTKTKTAYAAWQRRCGYSGPDADGIPGRDSLTRLGARHGFTVV
ncbi:endolysin [Streptomyces sp. BPTC-684]|uniref:endolysin n=1 Tax=Streptomyces sp. BPTC-684 TaxID=3043734 RepID=UPI0024B0DC4D|nr:endolysin [Streptomyces sp. BPTC-684]WHM40278.1 endolysin [Streptomyces sp. BPTC-684]